MEQKREKFLKIGRECCSIEGALQVLLNPQLEAKAAEELLPVCSNVRKWIEELKVFSCPWEEKHANVEPKEKKGIEVGKARKLLDEIELLGRSIRLQDFQMYST